MVAGFRHDLWCGDIHFSGEAMSQEIEIAARDHGQRVLVEPAARSAAKEAGRKTLRSAPGAASQAF